MITPIILLSQGAFPPSHFSNKLDDILAHKVASQTNVTPFCLFCQPEVCCKPNWFATNSLRQLCEQVCHQVCCKNVMVETHLYWSPCWLKCRARKNIVFIALLHLLPKTSFLIALQPSSFFFLTRGSHREAIQDFVDMCKCDIQHMSLYLVSHDIWQRRSSSVPFDRVWLTPPLPLLKSETRRRI
jgi:hypothetical protein